MRINILIRILILVILGYFFSNVANAKTIKVAVIDTGLDKTYVNVPLCETGHKDFTTNDDIFPSPSSLEEIHGTHIAGVIAKYAEGADYCLVIMKYYSKSPTTNINDNINKALQLAIDLEVDIINMSFGGSEENPSETVMVKKALDKGIKIVAAAGNERLNIGILPFYPACDDPRVYIVEALNTKGDRLPASNFMGSYNFASKCGTNIFKEVGEAVTIKTLDGKGLIMSGTSQATAIRTGKLVKYMSGYNKANEAYIKDKYFNRSK